MTSPPVDLYDRAAIVAILARWSRAHSTRDSLVQQKERIEQEIIQQDGRMTDCYAGLRVLGFDVFVDGVWNDLAATFGDEVGQLISTQLAREVAEFTQQLEGAGEAYQDLVAEPSIASNQTPPPMPTISKIATERLREAGELGTKAAAIREFILRTYGRHVHEKTVGMSLYRLSQQSPPVARREGHTWFFVPPSADAKNPGADDAGAQVVALGERRMRDATSRP